MVIISLVVSISPTLASTRGNPLFLIILSCEQSSKVGSILDLIKLVSTTSHTQAASLRSLRPPQRLVKVRWGGLPATTRVCKIFKSCHQIDVNYLFFLPPLRHPQIDLRTIGLFFFGLWWRQRVKSKYQKLCTELCVRLWEPP